MPRGRPPNIPKDDVAPESPPITETISPDEGLDVSALDSMGEQFAHIRAADDAGAPLAPGLEERLSYNEDPVHGPIHQSHELWERPSKLQAPPAPEDMQQRWVRVRSGTEIDVDNLQEAWEMGWRPRPAESVPADSVQWFSRVNHREFGQVLMRKGLLLCWRPKELGKRWRKYLDQEATHQMVAVDEQMREADSRNSQYIASRRSTVTVGRRVNVPSD